MMALRESPNVRNMLHMSNQVRDRYLGALSQLNVSEVARQTGRALRTLQSYQLRERRITEAAARELVAYLRERSGTFTAAADAIEAALAEEEANG